MGNIDSVSKIKLEEIGGTSISEKLVDNEIADFPYMSNRLKPVDWKSIVDSSKPWTDPNFRANKNAILDPMIRREKRIKNWENFVWKRPSEVYGQGNFTVFNDVKPDDIKQGHCGDCYFLSCLSSIAEQP